MPEDYESVLKLAETTFPDFVGVVALAEAVELIPEETLETELRLASAEGTAVSSIAVSIDSRKLGERKIHDNIAELTQRAFRAGERYALLSQRKRWHE